MVPEFVATNKIIFYQDQTVRRIVNPSDTVCKLADEMNEVEKKTPL